MSVVSTFGRFLDEYPWSAFATLTFRQPRWSSALRFMRPFLAYISRSWEAGGAARAFAAEEYHKDGKRLHLHALIFIPGHADLTDWWQWWFNKFGRAKLSHYDAGRGAHHYVAKYVVKEALDKGRYALFSCQNGEPTEHMNLMLWRTTKKLRKSGIPV